MLSSVVFLLVALLAFFLYSNLSSLSKNIAAAKRSGLPYIVTPINLHNPLWMASQPVLLPILTKLPRSWTGSWVNYMDADWAWNDLHTPWEKNGEIFLTVAPGKIHAWVTNAEAVRQITERRTSFPKPVEIYKLLDVFGRNVVTTEGIEWKAHRKITSSSFNEKNNSLVFAESCRQAQGLLNKWTSAGEKGRTINTIAMDTMVLALHVISSVGFGVRLLWPGETAKETKSYDGMYAYGSDEVPKGYTMSFEHALNILLERIIWIILVPKRLLSHLPMKGAQEAYEAYKNWSHYMDDIFARKKDQVRNGESVEGMDLLGSLVKTAYGSESSTSNKLETSTANNMVLSDSHILGNAFVMILAGHETTANSLFNALVELALNPESQRQAQKEVEAVYGDATPEKWDYSSSINKLLGGMLGAILSEQLRLMPPSITVPKTVLQEQDIMIDGRKVVLPAGIQLNLVAHGAHRNPRYWPTQASSVSSRPDDLDDFKPERWFVNRGVADKTQTNGVVERKEDDNLAGDVAKDNHSNLFRPVPGSYFPFSEGARSCLGRRIAQVEIMAVLAVIFQQHSIELAVDEWASDDEVAAMSIEEKKLLYGKAQEKARQTVRTATTIITLRVRSGTIPIRIVRKGEENFIKYI